MKFPNPEKQKTADGSLTLYLPDLDEHYHSINGAYTESMHVFIQSGLEAISASLDRISVLEIGFGTGLNAWLTGLWANHHQKEICYTGVDSHPLSQDLVQQFQFPQLTAQPEGLSTWKATHEAEWEKSTNIGKHFTLNKRQLDWIRENIDRSFDLIYYDAFAPNKQPEMWTLELFKKTYDLINSGGVLVTYTAKGDVRRAMQSAGFHVEKIPGPPGKREMLRAWKG